MKLSESLQELAERHPDQVQSTHLWNLSFQAGEMESYILQVAGFLKLATARIMSPKEAEDLLNKAGEILGE